MLEVVLDIPFWFEMLATLTGAVSGSMAASRQHFDLFGTMVIATVTGLGGGVIRDVLLQDYGIYAFQRPSLIVGCVICAIAVFYFGRLTRYLNPAVNFIDSLSIGMWAIISCGKALSAGLTLVPSVVLGTVVSIGGGVMRDIIMNRPVAAFQPGSPYGTAALAGSLVYCLMRTFHVLDGWSAVICLALIVAIRFGSQLLGLRTRPSRDLSEPLAEAVARPVRAFRDIRGK